MLFLLDTNRYGDENGGVYACTGVGVPVHYIKEPVGQTILSFMGMTS